MQNVSNFGILTVSYPVPTGTLEQGGPLPENRGALLRPLTQGKGGGLMDIISVICSIVSAGCGVFSGVFGIYVYHQQHHNDEKKK